MRSLKTLICLSLVLSLAGGLKAQTMAKIQNTNISLDNDRIIITYDLVGPEPGEKFEVWLRITDANGVLIQGRNFSGDIGKNIEGGEGLVIYWDFEKDQITISEEISIQVMAEVSEKQSISYIKVLLLSTVLPGLGLAKIEDKKIYSLAGIAGYGSLAFSLGYMFNSKDLYQDYSNSNLISERESYYNDYINHRNMAEIFGWSAAAIWLADYVWMTIKYGQSDKHDYGSVSHRISLNYSYCVSSGAPVISMKVRF